MGGGGGGPRYRPPEGLSRVRLIDEGMRRGKATCPGPYTCYPGREDEMTVVCLAAGGNSRAEGGPEVT